MVEKSVPPKEEIIIDVELTVPQKQYYRAIYEMNTSFLFKVCPVSELSPIYCIYPILTYYHQPPPLSLQGGGEGRS